MHARKCIEVWNGPDVAEKGMSHVTWDMLANAGLGRKFEDCF